VLDRVDRILVAARDADGVAERWCALVDAVVDRRVDEPALGSRKVVLRVGDAELEIHEPIAAGPVAEHVERGAGPLAAGLATTDLSALLAHLDDEGIRSVPLAENRYFLDAEALDIPGLRVVVSAVAESQPTGLLENLYECTHLTDDAERSAERIARVFGLDASVFVPIESENYGYRGSLTLFDDARLHRIETINPHDRGKTMGRYFERFGPSLYMCYGEAASIAPLRERLKALAPGDWTGSEQDQNGLFVHPKATGSTMLGVSRTTWAWSWSGHPERIEPLAD